MRIRETAKKQKAAELQKSISSPSTLPPMAKTMTGAEMETDQSTARKTKGGKRTEQSQAVSLLQNLQSLLPPCDDADRMQAEVHIKTAMAKGEQRDFVGAREDARLALKLCTQRTKHVQGGHKQPAHQQDWTQLVTPRARRIEEKCQLALKLERGPKEGRWTGPLIRKKP